MSDSSYCSDCRKESDVVLDHRTGDSICCDCGLVLEAYYIDESSEWRTFADDNNDKDPNRVGGPGNLMLSPAANLTTTISRQSSSSNNNNNNGSSSVKNGSFVSVKWHPKDSQQDKMMISGFGTIGEMADRLGIVETIRMRACEIYKQMVEKKCCTERSRNPNCAAALFIACRAEKSQRTLKEIFTVGNGASMKEINKSVVMIRRTLNLADTGSLQPTEFVRRFCSKLGMTNQEMRAVREGVEKAGALDIRRNPKSVLAAIIYLVSQLSDQNKPLGAIAMASEVAEGTVKKSYKDLYPHASTLIPKWYATEEDLKKLCKP